MKWEYHCLKIKARAESQEGRVFTVTRSQADIDEAGLAAEMNALGEQGWELVSALDTNAIEGATRILVLMFKRPRA